MMVTTPGPSGGRAHNVSMGCPVSAMDRKEYRGLAADRMECCDPYGVHLHGGHGGKPGEPRGVTIELAPPRRDIHVRAVMCGMHMFVSSSPLKC